MSATKIKKLRTKLRDAEKIYSQKLNSIDCTKVSYERYREILQPYADKVNALQREVTSRERVKWNDIPDYGHLMTMEDWLECVEGGGFIDYDGHGSYSDGERESNKTIRPSDVENGYLIKRKDFTHVIWYNR